MKKSVSTGNILIMTGVPLSVHKCLQGPYKHFEGEVILNPNKVASLKTVTKYQRKYPNITFRMGVTKEDFLKVFGSQVSNVIKHVPDIIISPEYDSTLRFLGWEDVLKRNVVNDEVLFNHIKQMTPGEVVEEFGMEFIQDSLVSTIAYSGTTGLSTTHLKDPDESTIYSSKESRRKRRDDFMKKALADLREEDILTDRDSDPEVSKALHYKPVFIDGLTGEEIK